MRAYGSGVLVKNLIRSALKISASSITAIHGDREGDIWPFYRFFCVEAHFVNSKIIAGSRAELY